MGSIVCRKKSDIQLVLVRDPFQPSVRDTYDIPYEQRTVASIVPAVTTPGTEVAVILNGQVVLRDRWETTYPLAGSNLTLIPIVEGGGKGMWGLLATMGLFFALGPGGLVGAGGLAGMAGGGAFGAFVFYGTVMVGGMLISSLISGGPPKNDFDSNLGKSATYGWNPRNTQEQGIVVPRFYGRNRMYGNVISVHSEVDSEEADKQRMNLIICLGVGPIQGVVSGTLRINDRPITSFDEVDWEEKKGTLEQTAATVFTGTKTEYAPMILVSHTGGAEVYTTPDNDFDDLEIDLLFDKGLNKINDAGGLSNYSVDIEIEISESGEESYTTLVETAVSAKLTGQVRFTYIASETYTGGAPVTIERGKKYDIRVTKQTADKTTIRFADELKIGAVREVFNDGFVYPRRAFLAITALANDQLYGSLEVTSEIEGAILMTYNGAAWVLEYSNNPAWVVWDILTSPVISGGGSESSDPPYAVERYDGYDPDDLDLAAFYAWAQFCDELIPDGEGGTSKRVTYNGGFDTAGNRWEAAQQVASIARGLLLTRGKTITVVIDQATDVVSGIYCTGNIIDAEKTEGEEFTEIFMATEGRAEEIVVDYIDADRDYDKVAFSIEASDVSDATNPLSLQSGYVIRREYKGITNRAEAWRLAMMEMARNVITRRAYKWSADIDALTSEIGDRVRLHDTVMDVVAASGRVVSGSTTHIIADQDLTLATGKVYSVSLRQSGDDTVELKAALSTYNPILAIDIANKKIYVTGDYTTCYKDGDTLQLVDSEDSAGDNDGEYTLNGDAALVSGAVAHYKLDENAANTSVTDSTGTQAAATASQNTSVMHTTGQVGGGLDFNGTTDYVNIPHDASQLLTSGFTFAAWIQPDSQGESGGRILDKSAGTSATGGWRWGFAVGSDVMVLRVNAGGSIVSNTITVDGTTWVHVAVTVTAAGAVIHYINGVADLTGNTAALAGITTTNDMRIGNRSGATDRSFDGVIDDVRIFNRVLSPTEIELLYAEQTGADALTELTVDEAITNSDTGGGVYNKRRVVVSSAFSAAAAEHDVYIFGETGEVGIDVRLTSIQRDGNQRVTMQGIEYNAEIYDYDASTPTIPITALTSPEGQRRNSTFTTPSWEDIKAKYPVRLIDAINSDLPYLTNVNFIGASDGTVSWEARDPVYPIEVTYHGVVTEITPDSTSNRYIYFDENYLTAFQTTNSRDDLTAAFDGKFIVCINDSGTAIKALAIPLLHAEILIAGTLQVDWAYITNVEIESAQIGALAVDTINIANQATMAYENAYSSANIENSGAAIQEILDYECIDGTYYIQIEFICELTDTESTPATTFELQRKTTGGYATIATYYRTAPTNPLWEGIYLSYIDVNVSEGTLYDYRMIASGGTFSRYRNLVIKEWKGK